MLSDKINFKKKLLSVTDTTIEKMSTHLVLKLYHPNKKYLKMNQQKNNKITGKKI